MEEINHRALQYAWKFFVKDGKLDFWVLRVQLWGSYQKDKEINPALLLGCLLIVNIPMKCATKKNMSTDAEYGANSHKLVKKIPKPSVFKMSSAG